MIHIKIVNGHFCTILPYIEPKPYEHTRYYGRGVDPISFELGHTQGLAQLMLGYGSN